MTRATISLKQLISYTFSVHKRPSITYISNCYVQNFKQTADHDVGRIHTQRPASWRNSCRMTYGAKWQRFSHRRIINKIRLTRVCLPGKLGLTPIPGGRRPLWFTAYTRAALWQIRARIPLQTARVLFQSALGDRAVILGPLCSDCVLHRGCPVLDA